MSVHTDYLVGTVYKAASVVGNTTVPFEPHIASGWEYMTNNYSKFTVATLFSIILHEVSASTDGSKGSVGNKRT